MLNFLLLTQIMYPQQDIPQIQIAGSLFFCHRENATKSFNQTKRITCSPKEDYDLSFY